MAIHVHSYPSPFATKYQHDYVEHYYSNEILTLLVVAQYRLCVVHSSLYVRYMC
jgi:hypothetical protein